MAVGLGNSLAAIRLVSSALHQQQLSGLEGILQSIAEDLGAFGCMLWELQPQSDLQAEPPAGQLYAVARWGQDDRITQLHYLPLDSYAGHSILRDRLLRIEDIRVDDQVSTKHGFFDLAEVQSFCAIPLRFGEQGRGALNVYWQTKFDFRKDGLAVLQSAAELVAGLYRAISDRAAFTLINRVDELLQNAARTPWTSDWVNLARGTVQKICNTVAEAFQCLEVAVFLRDWEKPAGFRRLATTCPPLSSQETYQEGESLTGWIARARTPLFMLDLHRFEEAKESLPEDYQGITHHIERDATPLAKRELDLDPEYDLPFSFMAAPILLGDQLFGIIRCSVVRQPPHYFSGGQLGLLQLVAAQLAPYHYLAITLRRQNQTYEDFKHQLEGPLIQAQLRLAEVLGAADLPEGARKQLFAVRGLVGKSGRVARSTGQFADISRGVPIPFKPQSVRRDDLMRMIIEGCQDSQLHIGRGIKFDVDASSFDLLLTLDVSADMALLEQAVNNVLDNAFKYSFNFKIVKVALGVDEPNTRVRLSFRNQGITLTEDEAKKAPGRGYRSPEAQYTTGEGTGIGLFIVDHIMNRHGGELEVRATDDAGWTEVRLWFPYRKRMAR